ncbi:MAG: toxin-antitoxin system HicB family antitoxin [Clostridia bacterium]
MKNFATQLANLPVVEPDEADRAAIKMAEEDQGESAELGEFLESLTYSGKLSLRIPKSLHHDLALAAKREGVSLNQYALYKLSQATPNTLQQ